MSSVAFTTSTPVTLRSFTAPLVTKTPPTKLGSPARRMKVNSLLQAMFGNTARSGDADKHAVLGTPQATPAQAGGDIETATFGLGCFWGAERKYWQASGVTSTSVGYAGGTTPDPNYRAVCTGRTGHAEVVSVLYDARETSFQKMLDIFWDAHNPTTLNRQGNDVGTQYRSMIMYYNDKQKAQAEESKAYFDKILKEKGFGPIVTEIVPAQQYYLAEGYHQQYLHKNPGGYCGLGGLGCYAPPQKAEAK